MDKSILLKVARAETESTPPGYVIEELVRMSMNPEACYEIEDFFLRFLGQNFKQYDPYVKCKILRSIRHICENGNPQFRFSLQRKASVLKSFLSYRAPPDPLRGDALIREVRDEADKCIKALYGNEAFSGDSSFTKPQFYRYNEMSDQSEQSTSRIEGFGSDSLPLSSISSPVQIYSDASSRRFNRMEGFGNPYFAYQNDPSIKNNNVVDSVSSVVSMQAGNLVSGLSQAASSVTKYIPESIRSQIGTLGEMLSIPNSSSWPSVAHSEWKRSYQPSNSYNFSESMESHHGISSYSPPYQQHRPSLSSNAFHRAQVSPALSPPQIQPTSPTTHDTASFSFFNHKQQSNTTIAATNDVEFSPLISLVDSICCSTISSKPAPARSTLAEFTNRVNLDPHSSAIVPILLAKLIPNPEFPAVRQATTWQAKYRVISCLDSLINPSYNIQADSREAFERSIKASCRQGLTIVRVSTPKCAVIIDDLLDKLQLAPSSLINCNATSADYLIDSSFTSDQSTESDSDIEDGGVCAKTQEVVANDDLLGDLLGTTKMNVRFDLDSKPLPNISKIIPHVPLSDSTLLDDVLGFSAEPKMSAHQTINLVQATPNQFSGLFSGLSLSSLDRSTGELLDLNCSHEINTSSSSSNVAVMNPSVSCPASSTTESLKDVGLNLPKDLFSDENLTHSFPVTSNVGSTTAAINHSFDIFVASPTPKTQNLFHFIQ